MIITQRCTRDARELFMKPPVCERGLLSRRIERSCVDLGQEKYITKQLFCQVNLYKHYAKNKPFKNLTTSQKTINPTDKETFIHEHV